MPGSCFAIMAMENSAPTEPSWEVTSRPVTPSNVYAQSPRTSKYSGSQTRSLVAVGGFASTASTQLVSGAHCLSVDSVGAAVS